MKKAITRSLAAILTLLILISCLSACGISNLTDLELPEFILNAIEKTPFYDYLLPVMSADTLYHSDVYMAYTTSEDKTFILANGELIKQDFDGEVTLVPAKDNSFAYVLDEIDDEVFIYVIKGTKIERITDRPASEVLALAGLKPGVVYKTSNDNINTKYNIYSEKGGEDQGFTTENEQPANFIMSDDASTVVYTTMRSKTNDSSDLVLTVYQNGLPDTISPSNGVSPIPVAVSKDGRYIYNVRKDASGTSKLYITDLGSKNKDTYDVPNSENFLYVADMNVKGNEILFCTGKGEIPAEGFEDLEDFLDSGCTDVTTSLYKHNAPTENLTTYIGKNVVVPANKDADVAIYKTFLGKYFTTKLTDSSSAEDNVYTYNIDKKYVVTSIANTPSEIEGKFSPDGNYFYYIDKNANLKEVDLKDRTTYNIYTAGEVADFAITSKGNLFVLDIDDNSICHIEKSSGKKTRFDKDSFDGMSFHETANKLYFTNTNADESSVWVTEEDKEESVAKFGKTELKALPYFFDSHSDNCYAAVYDPETENISIYYSNNGGSFRITNASDCINVIF